jgi:hypothetical protein
MRVAIKRAWFRMQAAPRLWDIFAFRATRRGNVVDDGLPDHIRRDLGLLEGRETKGDRTSFQKQKMLEAVRLQQGPL